MYKRKILLFIMIIFCLVSLSSVNASDIYVSNSGTDLNTSGSIDNPYLTISYAINQSSNGDTIHLANDIFTGSNNTDLKINKKLTINGDDFAEINGNGKVIFTISKGSTLTLNNLLLTNSSGYFYSGICSYGTLNMNNCTISNSECDGDGAAIYMNGGTTKINNCLFINNTASSQGGAIQNEFGYLTVINSSFENNTAERGGAIYNRGTLTVDKSNFNGNKVKSGLGGGIKNWGALTVTNTIFTNNDGDNEGGAIYNFFVNPIIDNCTFINNSAYHGGAILSYGGIIKITKSIIKDNKGIEGSGIYNFNKGNFTVTDSVIINNTIFTAKDSITNGLYNWWGTNDGPSGISANVNGSRWNIMTFTSKPENLTKNSEATLIVSLNNYFDNNTKTINQRNTEIPGLVSFNDNKLVRLNNGIAKTNFIIKNETLVNSTLDSEVLFLNVSSAKQNNKTEPETNNTKTENTTNINNKTEEKIMSLEDRNNNKNYTSQTNNKTIKSLEKTGNPLILLLFGLLMIPLSKKNFKK